MGDFLSGGYYLLVEAIVKQAVKDINPRSKKRYRKDAERFFRSQWFVELTGLDGKEILKKLKQKGKA